MGTTLAVAAVLAITALAASMFSVELGLSVAVIEIIAGIAVGNTLHLGTPDWLVFLAGCSYARRGGWCRSWPSPSR